MANHSFRFLCTFSLWFLLLLPGSSQAQDDERETGRYVVQKGQMLAANDHITLIFNNSFDDFENSNGNLTSALASNSSESSDGESTGEDGKRSPQLHRLRPTNRIRGSGRECRQFTDEDKYAMLQKSGALNQQVMANSPEEAGRNFAFSYLRDHDMLRLGDMTGQTTYSWKAESCDETCAAIVEAVKKAKTETEEERRLRPLEDAVGREREDLPSRTTSSPNGNLKPSGTASECVLDRFVPVGNCTEAGDEEAWGYLGLCSYCRGVFMLGDACFPSILNAVRCKGKADGCIYDAATNSAHGRCSEQSMPLRVLRKTKEAKTGCDDWKEQWVQLPAACGCLLSSSSFLSPTPFPSKSRSNP